VIFSFGVFIGYFKFRDFIKNNTLRISIPTDFVYFQRMHDETRNVSIPVEGIFTEVAPRDAKGVQPFGATSLQPEDCVCSS